MLLMVVVTLGSDKWPAADLPRVLQPHPRGHPRLRPLPPAGPARGDGAGGGGRPGLARAAALRPRPAAPPGGGAAAAAVESIGVARERPVFSLDCVVCA